jgi:hypothetical protein
MPKSVLKILAIFLLSACTTIASYQGTNEIRDVGNISGSRVYIYSFLSPARQAMGSRVLEAFDRQLIDRLAQHSVAAEFGNSSLTAFEAPLSGFGTSRIPLPITETIRKNADEEAAFGAVYRLIIAPRFFSQTQFSGDGGSYRVIWTLMEVATGDVVWQTEMAGAYTPMIYDNERSEERASIIIDGAFVQMQQSGHF